MQEAAARAIREGRSQYTDATGLPALRERISQWYAQRYGLNISAQRIVVTAGVPNEMAAPSSVPAATLPKIQCRPVDSMLCGPESSAHPDGVLGVVVVPSYMT